MPLRRAHRQPHIVRSLAQVFATARPVCSRCGRVVQDVLACLPSAGLACGARRHSTSHSRSADSSPPSWQPSSSRSWARPVRTSARASPHVETAVARRCNCSHLAVFQRRLFGGRLKLFRSGSSHLAHVVSQGNHPSLKLTTASRARIQSASYRYNMVHSRLPCWPLFCSRILCLHQAYTLTTSRPGQLGTNAAYSIVANGNVDPTESRRDSPYFAAACIVDAHFPTSRACAHGRLRTLRAGSREDLYMAVSVVLVLLFHLASIPPWPSSQLAAVLLFGPARRLHPPPPGT
eukprot:6192697-Pleurochrysis_carterae.AAC.4